MNHLRQALALDIYKPMDDIKLDVRSDVTQLMNPALDHVWARMVLGVPVAPNRISFRAVGIIEQELIQQMRRVLDEMGIQR